MGHSRSESRGTQSDTSMQQTTAPAALDGDLEQLDAFLGKWHMEGQQLAGPAGPAASISALQSYEPMAGNQFLVHRFDGHVGDSQASCIEIIGFDADRRCFRAHTFYNNGQMNVWDIDRRDGRWRVLGDWNASGRPMKVRCMIGFTDDGNTMNSTWEHSSDGMTWQVFWKVSAQRVMDH
jgi:hypothetical protein